MSFSLTKKTDYALLALARLAGETDQPPPSVSARQIAQEYNLPQPLLTNVMKELQAAGLIASRRGAGGGYHLARPALRITLADVVAAMEGAVQVMTCCADDHDEPCLGCRLTQRCPITGTMRRFNDAIVTLMHRLTLADLMNGDLEFALHLRRSTQATVDSSELSLVQMA